MQFMAIVRRNMDDFTEAQFAPLLEPEAEAVRALYAEGVVRTIWSRGGVPGGVIAIEAESAEEARSVVESFPLARHGMLVLEQLIPLRGYRGFAPRGS